MASVLACGSARYRAIALSLGLAACTSGDQTGSGEPSFSLSATSITFNATKNGDTPPPQQIIVTVNNGTVFLDVDAGGSGFGASLQLTGPASGVITVTPPAPFGDQFGNIIVKGCRDQFCIMGNVPGSPKTIGVAYFVKALSVSPPFVNFSANEGNIAAAQNITLDTSPGTAAWTSSVAYLSGATGWLSIPPSGPSRPATITLNPPSMLAGVHRANITLTASGASISVPVVFMAHSLGVNFVSPYVATANVSGEVIVRGYGFSSIADPQVMFGATAATAITAVSDTEIRASYPALAQGNYQVTVKNASQSLPTRAKLVVVDTPAYPFAAISRSGGVTKVIYDAERQALYLLNVDSDVNNNRIERYRFNGIGWTSDSLSLPIGGLFGGMALSPDGTEIIVAAFSTISHVDPNTLAITAGLSASPVLGPGPLGELAMANDGGAIGAFLLGQNAKYYRYDVLLRDLVPLSAPADIGTRRIYSSGDGRRLILAKPNVEPTSTSLYYYDSGNGTLVATPVTVRSAIHVGVSRTASRLIIEKDSAAIGGIDEDRVFDNQFNLLGTLPPSGGLASDVVAVSPDGTKGYRYVVGTGVIRVFDLAQSDGLGGFVEMTGITVPALGSATEMTISPDGGTLFLVSAEQLLVVPVP